uniref:WGS project CAEQ00000000 data, annotated contig 2219 n=1 Tax=Trypanosoma congolense (strain IL3000) TaxID=1068625 RepID=F9WCE5_TRYCI|nr:unnamed protein product [Trypanosoma congolense IL3000]
MTCIVQAPPPAAIQDHCVKLCKMEAGYVLPTASGSLKAPAVPRVPRRNTFTVSYAYCRPDANIGKAFLDEHAPPPRHDMEFQRATLRHHHLGKTRELVEQCEKESIRSRTEHGIIALKLLVRTAAERSVRLACACGSESSVVYFVRRVWSSLLHQMEAFFSDALGGSPTQRMRVATEYVSAMGIWFDGDMSLSFRRHVVQMPLADGTTQDVLVVGLAFFGYSSYVTDLRRRSQLEVLSELRRLSKQLGQKVLFSPVPWNGPSK